VSKSHYIDYVALKICLRHNFEMAVIPINACQATAGVDDF